MDGLVAIGAVFPVVQLRPVGIPAMFPEQGFLKGVALFVAPRVRPKSEARDVRRLARFSEHFPETLLEEFPRRLAVVG